VAGLILAFAPPLPYAAELPATVLYGVTYARIAWAMWNATREASPVPGVGFV
jgi:hypothetical protein